MKLAVKVAIAAAMLHGSAHAAEKTVASDDAALHLQKGKTATVQHAPRSGKHSRMAGRKTAKPAETEKSIREVTTGREDVTETPPASIQQTVQLKGVRG